MSNTYHDGALDIMFTIRDLVEEWLPEDPQSFLLEFWALQEDVARGEG